MTNPPPGAAVPQEELEAIRARHEARMHFSTQPPPQIAADFATLLRAVDRLSAELAKERERRVEVEGALKPFAEVGKRYLWITDEDTSHVHGDFRCIDLRRAATITKDTP